MRRTKVARWGVSLAMFLVFARTAVAADWAVVTLAGFPEYAVVGTPVKLTFTVRQQGVALLSALKPAVQATTSAGLMATSKAVPGNGTGEYTAALVLPQPGEWTVTVASGFNDSRLVLPTLTVIPPGTASPLPFSLATRGVRLFAAKGCVGCHRHLEVNPERTVDPKLDLTGKRFDAEYLRRFLTDPSVKRIEVDAMPNLHLTSDEIDALMVFIDKLSLKKDAMRGTR